MRKQDKEAIKALPVGDMMFPLTREQILDAARRAGFPLNEKLSKKVLIERLSAIYTHYPRPVAATLDADERALLSAMEGTCEAGYALPGARSLVLRGMVMRLVAAPDDPEGDIIVIPRAFMERIKLDL